jgi:flagellar motor switch protein FliG
MIAAPHTLTGAQRAAVLVVALGVEAASALLPTLDDDEVERVSVEVARLERVPGPTVEAVLRAYRTAAADEPAVGAAGGLDAARQFVRESLDEARAGAILPRVEAATEGTGFALLAAADSEEVAAFLAEEHPQTAAVVLSQLAARAAADALGHLPPETRGDVVRRLSLLTPPPASALRDLDAALRARFGAKGAGPDGVKRAADILTQAGRETGRQVLDALQAGAPDLAGRIESLLFLFDDLVKLEGRDLARVLADVDQGALALALQGADEALKEKAFANVSERVGAALREEIEMAGTPRVAEVEDAQRAVVAAALALAEAGEISLEAAPA